MPAQQSILIDEQGKLWDAASWQLRKSLYLNDVEGDVAAPHINNLGFVGVTSRATARSCVFNPKSVSRAAIGALYYLLSSRSCTRLGLTFALNGEAANARIIRIASRRFAAYRGVARTRNIALSWKAAVMPRELANFLRFHGAPRWVCY
jgi:hypothetical protein